MVSVLVSTGEEAPRHRERPYEGKRGEQCHYRPGAWQPQKLGEARKTLPWAPGDHGPTSHLDLRLPASGTRRESISVV